MAMVSLRRPKRKDGAAPAPAMPGEAPDYSYGLVIRLENHELDALGIKQLPAPGKTIEFEAKATVIRVAQSKASGNKGDRNLELQITHIDTGSEAEDKDKDD